MGVILKQLGVSEDTILKQLGFDPEHEQLMRESETASLGAALGRAFDAGTVA